MTFYSSVKINPCHWKPSEVLSVPFRDQNQTSKFLSKLATVGTTSEHLSIRLLENSAPNDPSLQVVKFVGRSPFDSSNMVTEFQRDQDLTNMFQVSIIMAQGLLVVAN